MELQRPFGVGQLAEVLFRAICSSPAKEADMQILMHARDAIPIARRDAEFVEGAAAALVLLAFLGLVLGTAAVDVARLVANLLA
jgi:hypothetical protein